METLDTFEEALAAEGDRLKGEEERLLSDDSYVSPAHEHLSYFNQGRYAASLERWLDVFPRDNFMFVRSEDMFVDPGPVYDEVTSWLGVSPLPVQEYERFNFHQGAPMKSETRAMLAERYAADNEHLTRLIGFDVSRWDRDL